MNILLLGSGGREHALALKMKESSKLSKLFIAPGNPGTAELGTNIKIDINNFEEVKEVALKNDINMVVVGPEEPLVRGIKDFFLNDPDLVKICVIGPSARGARLEGSKEYAKRFMSRYGIPTAGYKTVTQENIDEGIEFLETLKAPYVLKANGLAAGKGVLILEDLEEAKAELKSMLSGKFGDAGKIVVIEEFLKGIELSMFILTDGSGYVLLPEAKDYKRIGENDTGLNTGGMGAISPVPFIDDIFIRKVKKRIIIPTILGLQSEGLPYKGFIFFGLMNVDGNPYVIEYNVRMGDPETEVVMPRIKSDLVELLQATSAKSLKTCTLETVSKTAATVMMVSGGYPQSYNKEKQITGIKDVKNSIVYHAGTKVLNDKLVTNGGRVLAVTSLADNMTNALKQSYENIEKIKFEDSYCRKDIGFDLV